MEDKKIVFRGVNEGIYIETEMDDLEEVKEEIKKILKDRPSFYEGAKLLGFKADNLTRLEILELNFIMKYKYDIDIDYERLDDMIEDIPVVGKNNIAKVVVEEDKEEDIGLTKFINKTIRSGQSYKYESNLVIIGDVNSGAMVEAGGNIVVLGNLRGVAHAGKDGDKSAIVASYNLAPTQLRIADKIARSPDKRTLEERVMPEIARIVDGSLIIEPYLFNK